MIGLFGMGQASQTPNEAMFIAVYTFSVAFYMLHWHCQILRHSVY